MSEQENKDPILDKRSSRRTFIKNSGLTVGGLVLGGAIGSLIGDERKTLTTQVADTSHHQADNYTEALQFFTRQEDFQTLGAATEVIFPEDENGPGAIKLGVPYYIDKQLASPWGKNAEDYRKFPLLPGESPLNNGEIFIEGIRKLNIVSNEKHEKNFFVLDEKEQIEILTIFEKGEVELHRVSSIQFFRLLRQATLEGCYCDPVYGGNKNMEGWKMKEFPGAQMSYLAEVEKEFRVISPISLSEHKHS